MDEDFNYLNNIDNFLLYSESLQGLEEQIGKLIKLCQRINLKLSPSKFTLSESVTFGGTVISAEKIKNQSIIFLDQHGTKFLWTPNMQEEFDQIRLIFKDQIRLRPNDPSKELNILLM